MEKKLRATPHAVSLTAHDDSIARVWYGRMVLPPKDAYSPSTDTTYGHVRQLFMDTPREDIPSGLGCSSIAMKAIEGGSRSLDGSEEPVLCADDELYCWFRCMPLAEQNLTADSCAEQNLQLQCANPRDQVVPDGKQHGDYYPSCTNSTEAPTAYPLIDQQNETSCPDQWQDFISKDNFYDHIFNLTGTNGGDEAYLMWSVVDGSKIRLRLIFNNVFGWLAVGFADPDGKHNGMNGGNIILAVPGGNYSAATGLDMEEPSSIGTYVIDSTDSSFRHWENTMTPANKASIDNTDCFTSITFEGDSINGKYFDIDGNDEMIWGGNGEDSFVGYHGRGNRARFSVEWKTGNAAFWSKDPKEDEPTTTTSSSPVSRTFIFMSTTFAVASTLFLFA